MFKIVTREFGEDKAVRAIGYMKAGKVVDITERLALSAAQLSSTHQMPMADSLILAVARQNDATLWTMDSDFVGLSGVRYFRKV